MYSMCFFFLSELIVYALVIFYEIQESLEKEIS